MAQDNQQEQLQTALMAPTLCFPQLHLLVVEVGLGQAAPPEILVRLVGLVEAGLKQLMALEVQEPLIKVMPVETGLENLDNQRFPEGAAAALVR